MTWILIYSRIAFTFSEVPDTDPFRKVSTGRVSVSCTPDGKHADIWRNHRGKFPRDAVFQICAAAMVGIVSDAVALTLIDAVLSAEYSP